MAGLEVKGVMMMIRLSWALAASIVLTLPYTVSSAERQATIEYDCKFDVFSSAKGLEKADNFNLRFLLETASGKAVIIGNNGMSDVVTMNGSEGLTFLEIISTGAVQSTTITHESLSAVHSRHSLILGKLVPSQYYGQCVTQAR